MSVGSFPADIRFCFPLGRLLAAPAMPWVNEHRLVNATAAQHSDVVIGQYTYDGLGRRTKRVGTKSGQLDGTELYYYDKH